MRPTDRTEHAKNSAPQAAATGADSSDTSAPPRAGPPICAADRLPSRALLPRTN
ncbi:hypothetical protein QF032_001245 [Streptomyces achromogenes]|nr:hypothetical protein [Streptomyces achromogenes]